MTIKEEKNVALLAQAKLIFKDYKGHSDNHLIGYCRLVKELAAKKELFEDSVSIEGIEKDLKLLTPLQDFVIRSYFIENWPLTKVDESLKLTDSATRGILEKAVKKLRYKACEYSFEKSKKMSDSRRHFITEILLKIDYEEDAPITYLSYLSNDLKNFLTNHNMTQISQLLGITNEDLEDYYYLHSDYKVTFKSEIQKVQQLFKEDEYIFAKLYLKDAISKGVTFDYDFSTQMLNLNTREYVGLHRRDINLASQFLALTKLDILKIRNLGKASVDGILKVQEQLWNNQF